MQNLNQMGCFLSERGLVYCFQLWVKFNKSTYLKLNVAYNNMQRRLLRYNRLDSASCMIVNNSIDNFDALLRKNIYGLENMFMTLKII